MMIIQRAYLSRAIIEVSLLYPPNRLVLLLSSSLHCRAAAFFPEFAAAREGYDLQAVLTLARVASILA